MTEATEKAFHFLIDKYNLQGYKLRWIAPGQLYFGFCNLRRREIGIEVGLSAEDSMAVLAHEAAHAIMGDCPENLCDIFGFHAGAFLYKAFYLEIPRLKFPE